MAYPDPTISSDGDSAVKDHDEDPIEEELENIHTLTVAVLKRKIYRGK